MRRNLRNCVNDDWVPGVNRGAPHECRPLLASAISGDRTELRRIVQQLVAFADQPEFKELQA